jgi:hypothetical protein
MRSLLLIPLLFSMSQPVIGWGDVGHRAVAYLAEKYLTDQGSDLVSELLANKKGYDISDASTWADVMKRKRPSTKPWHYIGEFRLETMLDIDSDCILDAKDDPPTSCSLNYKRDCNNKGCIVSTMESMVRLSDLHHVSHQEIVSANAN